MSKKVNIVHIPIKITLGTINKNKGVFKGGDHIVLLSNVDLSTIGTPKFA